MTGESAGKRQYGWPTGALIGDYLRAGAGFAATFPPLLFVEWTAPVVIILGGLSGLFAWLGLRTLGRQRARLIADQDAIARGRLKLRWREINQVKLRRYGARKKKGGGYFELVLAGPGARIKIDSEISDFLDLARRIHGAARDNRLSLDARTRAHFSALGIEPRPDPGGN